MKCVNCNFENQTQALQCFQCGESLTAIDPSPPSFAFWLVTSLGTYLYALLFIAISWNKWGGLVASAGALVWFLGGRVWIALAACIIILWYASSTTLAFWLTGAYLFIYLFFVLLMIPRIQMQSNHESKTD